VYGVLQRRVGGNFYGSETTYYCCFYIRWLGCIVVRDCEYLDKTGKKNCHECEDEKTLENGEAKSMDRHLKRLASACKGKKTRKVAGITDAALRGTFHGPDAKHCGADTKYYG
jgi:hypothetical protein